MCDCCKKLKSVGFIRGKKVCKRCFPRLREDNKLRNNKGLEIPNNFEVLRNCGRCNKILKNSVFDGSYIEYNCKNCK